MIKVQVISVTALLLGIGYAWAVDESQKPAEQSLSGRPSMILSQNECQTLWNDARSQSAGGSSESTAAPSSSGRPAETSKSVALEDSREVVDSRDASTSSSGTSDRPAKTNESVASQDSKPVGDSSNTSASGTSGRPAETSKSIALEDSRDIVDSNASASGTSSTGKTGDASSLTGSNSAQGLSKQHATPYIANFAMVDKDADGQISQSEFQDGCTKGSVQAAGGSPSDSSSSSYNKIAG